MTDTPLLERMGRQTIQIGSARSCQLRLDGLPEVAALIVHQGNGQLSFVPEIDALCSLDGRPLAQGEAVSFDFRSRFSIGQVELPVTHGDLCLMVMTRGYLKKDPRHLVIGRNPERCHLVLTSPGVSGRHARLDIQEGTLTDLESTSGTWRNGHRLPPTTATPVSDDEVLAVGPLPLPIGLARQIHSELQLHLERVVAFENTARVTQMAPLPGASATPEAVAPASPTEAPPPPAALPPIAGRHRTVMGTIRMVASSEHTIGRTQDNDVVLEYPQISSHHAKLTNVSGQLFLEDSGSELGTYVRGSRLRPGQRARVEDGEQLRFGPMPAILQVSGDDVDVVIEDREGWAGRPLFEIEASGISLVVPDRDDPKAEKSLLDGVSFKALPGDLIALMGPSGSGKTTLLHCLTGYLTPTQGEIRINGEPLREIFDTLRGSIGYVPQDDIIHPELTVREAVRYSARFRLPPDHSRQEIEERVDSTLRQLGLESVAHLQIGKPEQKVLSGGQRKRVNIAMELVTDPVLLFLDEPTSGLAADDTTALVELLARLARESGKTIVATIHQPARDEYQQFNLALILGHGGVELYFGPSRDAYGFFESWRAPGERQGIETPRDMFAELSEREARFKQSMAGASRAEIRAAVSRAFRTDYDNSSVHAAMFSGPRSVAAREREKGVVLERERPRGQLKLLLGRYFRVKARDRVGTAILLLQAPLIGVLLALVFGVQEESVPYWCLGALEELSQKSAAITQSIEGVVSGMRATIDNAPAINFLIVAAVWFGTSNAAREIVSERAIFRRERMVNLNVLNYVLSKFVVLSGLCILQCTILLTIVFAALGLAGGASAFFTSLGVIVLTSVCSVALGLLLSSVVASSEAAMALTPIALIPQVVLGGLMVPVTTNHWLEIPMLLIPARWGFEGVVRQERAAVADLPAWNLHLEGAPDSLPDYVTGETFHCATAQLQSSDLVGAWGFGAGGHGALLPSGVLIAMTLTLLALVVISLRRRS